MYRVCSFLIKTFLIFSVANIVYAMPKGIPSKAKTETCVACHNQDGNSVAPMWPKIAGQHDTYLYYQLKEFQKGQEGSRYDPTMYPMLQGLSDQDLANLAAFYAEQKTSKGETPQSKLELGEKLYRGGDVAKGVTACIACHGPRGLGNELAKYPRLSGQNAEYTAIQLKKYRSGERKTDPNAIMRIIAKKMTDEEIDAVSHYVSGLH